MKDAPRKPDFMNSLYFKDNNGKDQRVDLPASWKTDEGRNVVKTPFGAVVSSPRELLEKMRAEKQEKDIKQKQNPEF